MQTKIGIRSGITAVALGALAGTLAAAPTPVSEFYGAQLGENLPEDWAPCDVQESPLRGGFADQLWPGGVVPYAFSSNVNATNQGRALAAMDEIEAVCDVVFIPRTDEPAFIQFNASSSSNSSPLGYTGATNGIQIVSWSWRFIVVHEIMHSLGIYHEQQKPGRGDYITINWDNIQPDFDHNFRIGGGALPFGPYNFESIMHYSRCAFSVCSCSSCPTITVKPPNESMTTVIGQRNYLSQGDADTLAFLYDGPGIGDDAHEPNNDFAAASPIAPGTHNLVMGDAADFFAFTLAERSEVTVTVGTDEAAWQAVTTILDAAESPVASGANGPWDDGEPITATLDAGTYVVHVAQDLGFHPYQLALTTVAAPACAADCDGSGTLNIDDVDCFAAGFLAGDLGAADCDGSGTLNIDDVDCFAAAFGAGCP